MGGLSRAFHIPSVRFWGLLGVLMGVLMGVPWELLTYQVPLQAFRGFQ